MKTLLDFFRIVYSLIIVVAYSAAAYTIAVDTRLHGVDGVFSKFLMIVVLGIFIVLVLLLTWEEYITKRRE